MKQDVGDIVQLSAFTTLVREDMNVYCLESSESVRDGHSAGHMRFPQPKELFMIIQVFNDSTYMLRHLLVLSIRDKIVWRTHSGAIVGVLQ